MGQTISRSAPPPPRRPKPSPYVSPSTTAATTAVGPMIVSSDAELGRDHTVDLPDECLALVFHSLGSGDRKKCSLVCRRWFAIEGQSRQRLSLDARAALLDAAPALFSRFDAVSKLALKCDRRSDSIGDEALALISLRCPNLTRLKIRACRALTETGMAALAANCPSLRKLSCGSCAFGSKGIDAVLKGCPLLEELSIKRLRGLADAADPVGPGAAASSLRTICLKELYNGQCFGPLIAGCRNLKTLKLFRCSGDWDLLLDDIAAQVSGIVEIHLEKLQVSDRGLFSISACADLEVLHLVKTPECTDAGLAWVAEKCRLLRKIHIDGWKTNRIGDEGLMAVARRCPNLQELVLIGVNPTARSLGMIASNCRNLERLALCSSETFGDQEITCIAAKCMALKKLCIKSCPVSDHGMEALAEGCPNLIKVKVKKCKGVTTEGADWLRASRGTLAVNLDPVGPVEQQEGSISDSGMLENGADVVPGLAEQIAAMDLPSSNSGRSMLSKVRSFMASTLRKWYHGSSNCHHT
ncbi:hypothetical protein J5N97_007840 [Dioscorea zingiberensis]|uniref:F-box domain-containing protein n=1 Tax=Dioscorea zingiberensis TaxID=325984 RepID=A0A9D5DE10_9LILI|nr:hypothetical protein J5N97_007840 [Dioscorea zingiberensis]